MTEAYSERQNFEEKIGPVEDLGDMRDILNASRAYEGLTQETYRRLMEENASTKSPDARVYNLEGRAFLGFSQMRVAPRNSNMRDGNTFMVTFAKDGNDELVLYLGQKPFGNFSVQRYARKPDNSSEIVEMFAFDSKKPASSAAEALPYLRLLHQSTSQFGKPRE